MRVFSVPTDVSRVRIAFRVILYILEFHLFFGFGFAFPGLYSRVNDRA